VNFKLASLAVLASAASPALAHDFWLQPAQWNQSEGTAVEVTLQVGHGPDRQRSPIRASRLLLINAIEPNGSTVDLHQRLHLGGAAGDLSVGGPGDTPSMIVLATDAKAESHLDPERFNFHLKDEGLSAAITWRAAHKLTAAEGSENYGRVAKLLLVSKNKTNAIQRPLGLELEIVPLADPYAPGVRHLPIQVIFNHAPLQGAQVKLYDLGDDTAPRATCTTDRAGQCAFDFARSSSWLVNVVWSTPNPEGSGTDFRTIFSSLSFGFDPPSAERD
jgi:uncharacterized GH25 family protein